MCGRYVISQPQPIASTFRVDQGSWGASETRYNIVPSQSVPVIRSVEGRREVLLMRWGMIPFWAKGIPPKVSTINARVENLETAASWKHPWKHSQRCIIPANGFYEWHHNEDGSKQPYFIQVKDQPLFGFAGLWDQSTTAQGEAIESCTIITLPASPFMARIHNDKAREPAILATTDIEVWLSGSTQEASKVLKAYPDEQIEAWPVSKRVNAPKNNDTGLIDKPLSAPKQHQ